MTVDAPTITGAPLWRRATAEFLGTGLLVTIVVGPFDQAGAVQLTARYSGDASAATAESAAAAITVEKQTATIKAKAPIQIILKQDKYYRTLSLDYSGGLRYPRLEKTGEGEGSLDKLLQPKT